jgi:hypothetical protein
VLPRYLLRAADGLRRLPAAADLLDSGAHPCPPGSARSPVPHTDAPQCRDHTGRVILARRPGVSVNGSPGKLRHALEGIMIKELSGLPAGVIGFEASGRLMPRTTAT